MQARCTQLSTDLSLSACLVMRLHDARHAIVLDKNTTNFLLVMVKGLREGWLPEVDGPDMAMQNHINAQDNDR